MPTLESLKKELIIKVDSRKAQILQRYFKTEKGQYGEGDIFLGISVPELRKIAKKNDNLSLRDLRGLLQSRIHEERFVALVILIQKFKKAGNDEKDKIMKFYLRNLKWVNNWDLVDLSADKILGKYLFDKEKTILYDLAVSKNLWERRVAIIATFYFIKNNLFVDALKISENLLKDKHDLIHKAVGWMLREVGKRNLKVEEDFLEKNCKKVHRTTLRYAIEKFPKEKRDYYLRK